MSRTSRRQKSRLPVFLNAPSIPQNPPHYSSYQFAALLVVLQIARWLDARNPRAGIQLRYNESWAAVKERFRTLPNKTIPVLAPPREPEPLMLSYPPRNNETDGARRQRELWMNATRF